MVFKNPVSAWLEVNAAHKAAKKALKIKREEMLDMAHTSFPITTSVPVPPPMEELMGFKVRDLQHVKETLIANGLREYDLIALVDVYCRVLNKTKTEV